MLQIIFEFVDGPYDGKVLQGVEGGSDDAARYYLITNHGMIGQRFKVASDFAVENLARQRPLEPRRQPFRHHYYVVVERLEDEGQVLVRASYEYADSEAKAAKGREPASFPQRTREDEVASHWGQIQEFLMRAARGITQSYSACWPATTGQDRSGANLGLHVAHVMLQEEFSVFAAAAHPDPSRPAIDLLGIAPSQDWFLAIQFHNILGMVDLPKLASPVQQLRTFWLNTRLTIPACADHIVRMASYCEQGYGAVAGIHWSAPGHAESDVCAFWRNPAAADGPSADILRELAPLQVHWAEPVPVRRLGEQGTFYFLSFWFEINRTALPAQEAVAPPRP